MKKFYKIKISYDGTSYFGWQKTNVGPSIQETLAQALFKLSGEEILPEAASRTDRGVHAWGQIVAFSMRKPFDPFRLEKALNATLPADIRVHLVEEVSEEFHPTLLAIQKEYIYEACLGQVQSPVYRLYSWHYPYPLDLDAMHEAARALIGTFDFSAFTTVSPKNPICTLFRIEVISLEKKRLRIKLVGNRFLYRMARTLSGTLLYIGSGKLSPNVSGKLLEKKDRREAGMTAPAHGLFLHQVLY